MDRSYVFELMAESATLPVASQWNQAEDQFSFALDVLQLNALRDRDMCVRMVLAFEERMMEILRDRKTDYNLLCCCAHLKPTDEFHYRTYMMRVTHNYPLCNYLEAYRIDKPDGIQTGPKVKVNYVGDNVAL